MSVTIHTSGEAWPMAITFSRMKLDNSCVVGHQTSNFRIITFLLSAPVAQWVKRWPTDLADRGRS